MAEPLKQRLREGLPAHRFFQELRDWMRQMPGPLGELMRVSFMPLRARPDHQADHSLLPLPMWWPASPTQRRLRSSGLLVRGARAHFQMLVVALNWLHGGREAAMSRQQPTAAQKRCLRSMWSRCLAFARDADGAVAGGEAIRDVTRLHDEAYVTKPGALPLGARAGVPGRAACVDVGTVLDDYNSTLAAQTRDPSKLLLPRECWPPRVKKAYQSLDASYDDLLDKAVASGLQHWGEEAAVVHHQGVPRDLGGSLLERMILKIDGSPRARLSMPSRMTSASSRSRCRTCLSWPPSPLPASGR